MLILGMAGALMEIFAAILVLVPLLLPVAMSYGIDPVHFGIIFLANMGEVVSVSPRRATAG
jgi:TRAP-type C4-dicarboxylate transport system permease large subunit